MRSEFSLNYGESDGIRTYEVTTRHNFYHLRESAVLRLEPDFNVQPVFCVDSVLGAFFFAFFFFLFILDIKFVGRTSRGHTGRSLRISHPPSICGACLSFSLYPGTIGEHCIYIQRFIVFSRSLLCMYVCMYGHHI